MGGAGIVLGLATYGYKIMRVLGVKMVSAALCGGVRHSTTPKGPTRVLWSNACRAIVSALPHAAKTAN